MQYFQGFFYVQAIIYSLLCYLHGCTLKKNISFISKMPSSKQKYCITNWLKKTEKEKGKKNEEELLLTLPENEWYVIS